MEASLLKKRFLIFLDKGSNCYGAYSPDVPGCVSSGETIEETKANMIEALTLHLDGLYTDGDEIPEDSSDSYYLEFEWTPKELSDEHEKSLGE